MKKKWKCEEDILCVVKNAQEKEHFSDLEEEHAVSIYVPERVNKDEYFEAKIDIGRSGGAPAETAHFIEWIEVYAGDTFIGRTYFSAGVSYPQAVFKAKLTHAQGPLKVWAKCNLHGLWLATRPICAE